MSIDSEKTILIACPPSSGSTLLATLMNRHPKISCGPESSLLSNPIIYKKPKILASYLKTLSSTLLFEQLDGITCLMHGLAPTGIIYEDHLAYHHHSFKSILSVLMKSKTIHDVIGSIYAHKAEKDGKAYVCEKTPGNFFALPNFFEALPKGRVVLIVRNPYDQIVSLINRGYSFSQAASFWITHTTRCTAYASHPNAFLIKFEDLVIHFEDTLKELFEFLEMEPELDSITNYKSTNEEAKRDNKIKTWNCDPNKAPGKDAIGNGSRILMPEEKLSLFMLSANLKSFDPQTSFPRDSLSKSKIAQSTFSDLCQILGYELDKPQEYNEELLKAIFFNFFIPENHERWHSAISFNLWEISPSWRHVEKFFKKKDRDALTNLIIERAEAMLTTTSLQSKNLINSQQR
jgi:hypothetical protein